MLSNVNILHLLTGCKVDIPLNWNEFYIKEFETKRVDLKVSPFR